MDNAENIPKPKTVLDRITIEEGSVTRGKLKIFFGGCSGVGKTFAMLSAARERVLSGIDVAVGMVEAHDREDVAKLLEGVPVIPPVIATRGGETVHEFDLDAALARHPSLILLDELSHRNGSSSRHPKRWQDAEELLNAGIDVYTTLNVQHLESLSDLIAGNTGIWVKETVPDSIFDNADDVVLVDINADELLKRLNDGKIYITESDRAQATESFFKKSNIIAMRELALRRTTERVDAQMEAYNTRAGIRDIQPVADRVMVCIGSDHLSEKLIRTAKRMGVSLKAPWTAVYVENARHYHLSAEGKRFVEEHIRMADRLGGKTVILQGTNAVDEIINYAHENGITKIVVGKPGRARWKDMLVGSLADKIIRKSGYIDVYVVTGEKPEEENTKPTSDLVEFKPKLYWQSLFLLVIITFLGLTFPQYIKPNDEMLFYIIGNVLTSAWLGRGPSFLYALLSASCFKYFFLEPRYSFDIEDRSYWMTLIVMLVTSIVINSYASRLRLQAIFSRKRERYTQMLYNFTREVAATRGHGNISQVTAKHIKDATGFDIAVFVPNEQGELHSIWGELPHRGDIVKETGLMQWTYHNRRVAGRGTDTMPSAENFYMPLKRGNDILGVLVILPQKDNKEITIDTITLLETFCSLLAAAIERANTASEAEKLNVEKESEKMRNVLLSSVSHDLRTPLASITGASSTIVMELDTLPRDTVRDLGRSINQEASRLSRIVTNLLDVTSLESGTVRLNKQPYFIEEIIGSAVLHLEPVLASHKVITRAEPNLPMVAMDGVLIEQVVNNLIENAAKYTPTDSTITIEVKKDDTYIYVRIMDNGSGIKPGDEQKIFDKFYAAEQNTAQKGSGLGLSICQGIIAAHEGTIWAENLPEGGASFNFSLPLV